MTKEKVTITKNRKKIHKMHEKNEIDSIESNRHRARSITVGTAFGGVVEINLRSESNYLYAQMQPTETIELIEQLAAGVGVEIIMRPKVNFASWRGWEEVIDQRIGWDKIAWKGTAAWQLDGDCLEKNLQLEGKKEPKQLPSSDMTEKIKEKNVIKTRKKLKEQTDE